MNDFIDRISGFSQKRLTLLAAQLRDRIDALETRDKIAIVGMGCRLPGGVDTPGSYWELLKARRDVIEEIPADRWDVDAYYDPDHEAPGKITTRYGGWLDQIDQFDPKFFSISPREAQSLDPQQRLLMEVTWRALEHAGIPAGSLSGTRTGVFCGISGVDYHNILRDAGTETYDAYMASGVAHSVASGRLSYFLGVHGPSLSIDTACSSSLVAIHEAIQSLRNRECDTALAGGSNLILTPETTIALSRAQMMAPDGRCKAFDARANGFVRSEGCGMLVLKRLSDAERDGDRIVAVIRGSAINQDGRSNGLTAPNGIAQEAVLRAALKDAATDASEVGFVEAHGTGTSLGDPIEVHALGAALCENRERSNPLRIGSVKSSIGHLEAAAGVASLIKAALAVHHARIPGQANLETLNPLIQWDRHALEPPRETREWTTEGTRVAGVSSFGFSGTNVHIILEQAPEPAQDRGLPERGAHVLTVSARSAEALNELKAARSTEVAGPAPLADVAFSANARRDHFPHRFAAVVTDADGAYSALRSTGTANTAVSGLAPRNIPKIAFVFTGQGAQYAGMTRGMYDRHPIFRKALDRFNDLLGGRITPSLLEILHGTGSDIDDTALAQPALLAVELALAELWQSWGIRPSAVLGHSLGEYAAACVAGVLTTEDALHLVTERGRLMSSAPGDGAMASVICGAGQIGDLLAAHGGRVSIAAVNGPRSTVISGGRGDIDSLCAQLNAQGLQTTQLRVSQAFHSPLMDPILDQFENIAAQVEFNAPTVDIVSNVTGTLASPDAFTARYWRDHIRSAVRFHESLQTASDVGCDLFLEIGPHPTLTAMAQLDPAPDGPEWISSLRRGEDDESQMLAGLARLYVRGADVDWRAFDAPWNRQVVPLAGYPFERERFWVEAPDKTRNNPAERAVFPGTKISQAITDHTLLEMQLDPGQLDWIEDHRIHGRLAVPSPVFMAWALQVGSQFLGHDQIALERFVMHRPVDLTGQDPETVQFVLAPDEAGARAFRILVCQGADGWTLLCEGRLVPTCADDEVTDLNRWRSACASEIGVPGFYDGLAALGLEFGPRFRGATRIFGGAGQALARIKRPEELSGSAAGLTLHPALLDTSLHVIAAALSLETLEQPYLLLSVDRIEALAPLPDEFWCQVSVDNADAVAERDTFTADLQLFDDEGRVLMRFGNMSLRRVGQGSFVTRDLPRNVSDIIHEIVWRAEPGNIRPSRIEPDVLAFLDKLARENGLYDTYPRFQNDLNNLCSAYISNALAALGLRFDPGAVHSTDALMRELAIQPTHRRLLERMLLILAEDGVLATDDGNWRILKDPGSSDTDALAQSLLAEFPVCEPEISVTHRCASDIEQVLTGRVDPLTLLFPDGSLAQTEKLYSESAPSRTYNSAIADVVDKLILTEPVGKPVRILEIGAGTGSATARILERLGDRNVRYVFTDVSPLFVNAAQQRFGDRGGVEFATLDISDDPVDQGFSAGNYDIIVAGNVLHATADIALTLAHVSKLMTPGAKLVLLEGTAKQRFGDLTVGLLDGWWAYSDTDLRDYALMPRDRWNVALSDAGFDEIATLPGPDALGSLREQAIFVANWPGPQRAARDWLVVGEGDVAKRVCDMLNAKGDTAVALAAGDACETLSKSRFDGVVYMPALQNNPMDMASADQLMEGQHQLLGGALDLVQALVRLDVPPPQLFFVTEGAQATLPGESADPRQATLWGFGHTVAMEHPELGCRRVDMQAGHASGEMLLSELDRQDGETQVAFRNGDRLLRRLKACGEALSQPEAAFAPDETVLITGGLAGLGLLVAEWTVEHGARSLILLGRRVPSAEAEATIARMRNAGATVMAMQADVGNESDLEKVVSCAGPLLPVRTVIHAAGALDDGAVMSQNWSKFETVLNAKMRGSWLLQKLFPDLRHFVMFSSGASLAGSAGQANHAAANAFEDALAWYLTARGRSALTINWGLWGEIGAGVQTGVSRDADVLKEIDPDVGLAALGAVMFAPADAVRPQLAILDADWHQLAHGGHANAVFFSDTAPAGQDPAGVEHVAAEKLPPLKEQLSHTPVARQRTVVLENVRTQVRAVLGIGADEVIDAHEPLQQLGLDSLMAVQLRNLLSDMAALPLPATVIFDHPTTAALTDFLSGQLIESGQAVPEPDVAAAEPVESDALDTKDMSEDDLALHLLRELDRLEQGNNE